MLIRAFGSYRWFLRSLVYFRLFVKKECGFISRMAALTAPMQVERSSTGWIHERRSHFLFDPAANFIRRNEPNYVNIALNGAPAGEPGG